MFKLIELRKQKELLEEEQRKIAEAFSAAEHNSTASIAETDQNEEENKENSQEVGVISYTNYVAFKL